MVTEVTEVTEHGYRGYGGYVTPTSVCDGVLYTLCSYHYSKICFFVVTEVT